MTMNVPRPLLLGTLFVLEGEAARADGVDSFHNPYDEGTQQHGSWLRGWLAPDALPNDLSKSR
jgi:hypothetical protein